MKEILEEIQKCKGDPYYFYTNYFKVYQRNKITGVDNIVIIGAKEKGIQLNINYDKTRGS